MHWPRDHRQHSATRNRRDNGDSLLRSSRHFRPPGKRETRPQSRSELHAVRAPDHSVGFSKSPQTGRASSTYSRFILKGSVAPPILAKLLFTFCLFEKTLLDEILIPFDRKKVIKKFHLNLVILRQRNPSIRIQKNQRTGTTRARNHLKQMSPWLFGEFLQKQGCWKIPPFLCNLSKFNLRLDGSFLRQAKGIGEQQIRGNL